MIDFGTVRPGATLYIPFTTYAGSTGASVTLSGLAVGDIMVFKNGDVTQRGTTTGFVLLDTDGIDFDGITGLHGISIDLSSNATADFFTAGARYWVVVSSVTIDAQTVNFVAATFRIGYPGAILDTTIATLASQTSFTLTAGPAEDNALLGCTVVVHDIASAVQWGKALVTAYTGSTRTVTLAAGVSFTAAVGDNISVFLPTLQPTTWGRTLDVSATGEAGLDWANIGSPTTAQNLSATNIDVDQVVASVTGNVGGSVASVATNGITAASLATDAVGEIADAVWDEDIDAAHQTANTAGKRLDDASTTVSTNLNATVSTRATQTSVDAIATTLGTPTNFGSGTSTLAANLQDLADNGTATFDRSTDSLQALRDRIGNGTNLTEAGGTGDHLTALATQASVNTIDGIVNAILLDTGTDGVQLAMSQATPDVPTDNTVGDALTRARDALPLVGPGVVGGLATYDNVFALADIGSVADATPAAGDFDGDTGLTNTDDFYNGAFLVFTSGGLKGLARKVSDFTGASRRLQFTGAAGTADAPFPSAPVTGDSFVILGRHGA